MTSILGSKETSKNLPKRVFRVPQNHIQFCYKRPKIYVFLNEKAFDSRVILITGGTDKNLNFTPLAQALSGQAGARAKPLQTYLLAGSGTDKLLAMLKNINGQQCLGPFEGLSILLGVLKNNLLHQNAERIYKCFEGDDPIPVVFSPGATSFGMFTNEFDRGRKFKDAVKEAF